MIRPASVLQNGGLYPILTFSPAFSMISTMKTMFQGWFRAVSTGVCPYHQKSDFLSIPHHPATEARSPARLQAPGLMPKVRRKCRLKLDSVSNPTDWETSRMVRPLPDNIVEAICSRRFVRY